MNKILIFKHSEKDKEDFSVFILREEEGLQAALIGFRIVIYKSGCVSDITLSRLSRDVEDKWKEPTSEELDQIRTKAGKLLKQKGIDIY